jgi:ribosomal protein S15P/S13E
VSDTFEGDLIRPLGLVTLYFAYAEYELDRLLEDLSALEPFDDAMRLLSVGRKLSQAQMLLRRLEDTSVSSLEQALTEARVLFDRRNTIVHSCIFAGGRVVSGRPGVPETRTSPQDLVALAERIFNCKEHINVHRQKIIRTLLVGRKGFPK